MAKLTAKQIITAKSWLNDLLVLAKECTDAKPDTYRYMQGNMYAARDLESHAAAIVAEIKQRDFKDVDDDLREMANYQFSESMADLWSVCRKPADMLARYIAWLCSEYKIYWDDTSRFKEEADKFRETYLGKALFEAGCFASQPMFTSSSGSTRAASTGVAGAPKDSYKSSGPRSKDARDLVSTPGAKESAPDHNVYLLEGDPVGKGSIPAAYIRPLEPMGAKGSTNKVFVGTSWKSYRNCICFFPTVSDANAFLEKVVASGIAKDVAGFKVTKKTRDGNGYFIIGTEFGQCWIKASELNEELIGGGSELEESVMTEEVELSEEVRAYINTPLEEECYPSTDSIKDISVFADTYRKFDR